jgi:hypothetical protein
LHLRRAETRFTRCLLNEHWTKRRFTSWPENTLIHFLVRKHPWSTSSNVAALLVECFQHIYKDEDITYSEHYEFFAEFLDHTIY